MKPTYYFITYVQYDVDSGKQVYYNDLIIGSPFEWLKSKQIENFKTLHILNHRTILISHRQISKTEYDYCRDNIKF